MANLLDILKKAATNAVTSTVSNVKAGLKQGQQITAKQNQFAREKAEYDKQVAAIKSAPYTDAVVKQKVDQIKKPVAPSFIASQPSAGYGALNLSPSQLKDVGYYESVQKKPLSLSQLETYAKGNTPTLDAPWYQQLTAAARDTVNPLFQAADKLNTTTKFTNPALYQDREVNTFKQAQQASNAAGANAAWQTAKFTNPILRGMSVSAPAISNAVGAVGGDAAREVVDPVMNAYYKYNPKYIAGNLVTGGIQSIADAGVNLFKGKGTGVAGLINDSDLSPEQKDMASTLYQAGTNLAGAAAQKKFTNSKVAIKEQVKNDARALQEGWATFKKTGSLDAAADVALNMRTKSTAGSVKKPEANVLGYRTPEQKGIPVKKVVKERQVNLGKFSDSEAVQQGIKQQIASAKKDTYVKKSFKEMEAEAKQLSPDIQKLLAKSKDGLVSAEENMALTQLVAEQQRLINELKTSPQKDGVQAKIDQAQNLLNHALDKQLKGGTAVGRALVSNRYLANITTDPAYWLARAEKTAGRELNDTQRAQIDMLAKQAQLEPTSENKVALSKYVAELQRPTWWSNASATYKAGLITSPKTIARNFVGNKVLSTLETAKDLPAALVDKVVGLGTGKRGVVASPSAVVKKIASVPKGIADAKKVLTTGNSPLGLENTFEAQRETRMNNPLLDKTIGAATRTAFRIAGAGDAPFKRSNYTYSIAKQAAAQAANEGLKGKAKTARVNELIANPPIEMRQTATNDAKFATYQSDIPLIQKFNSAVGKNPITQFLADTIVPFKQIPANAFKTYGYDYSPLGGLGAIGRAVAQGKKGEFNQKQFSESIGRSLLGTGLLGIGSALYNKGSLAPSLPTDRNQLQMALEEGKQGHDLALPATDYKVDAGQLGAAGQLLSLGADISDISKKNGGLLNADSLGQVGAQALRTISDQPFLQGFTRAVDALKDPERSGGTYVRSAFSGIVPPFVNSLASLKDPEQRNAKTLADTLASRIPFLRDEVAKRVGIWGEPRSTAASQTGIFSLFDPVNAHKTKDDPIFNEMRRLGLDIGLPSDTLNGVKLTPKEYEVYQGTAGYNIKQVLDTLMNSDAYSTIPDPQKPDVIDAVIKTGRDVANEITFSTAMRKRYSLPDSDLLPDDVIVEATKMITSERGFTDKTPQQRASAVEYGLKDAAKAFEIAQQKAESDAISAQMQQMNAAIQQKEQEEQMQYLQNQLYEQQADDSLLELDY